MGYNRVSAGFSPAIPTPPGMRVRTRRLNQALANRSCIASTSVIPDGRNENAPNDL